MPDRALPLLPVDGLGRAAAEPAAPPSRAALPALPPRDAAARPTSRRRVPPPVPARADSSEPPVPGHSPRPEAGIAEEAEPPDPQTIALTRALMNGKPDRTTGESHNQGFQQLSLNQPELIYECFPQLQVARN